MQKMFFMATLVFSSLAFACTKCPQEPVGCIDESRIGSQPICTSIYDPVCGCDGITYGNQCEAENAGVIEYTKGECGQRTGKE